MPVAIRERPSPRMVGRDQELTEIGERIRSGARLITLHGPPGIGKSLLACEFAESARDMPVVACDLMYESALARVYVTVNRLRTLGLAPYIVRTDEGYMFEPKLVIQHVP